MSTWKRDTTYVQFIADYTKSRNLAFSEVRQTLWNQTSRPVQVNCVPVPEFNTLSTGFHIEQLGLRCERPGKLVIYANTAPRKDDQGPREDNGGEELLLAELENQVPVIATGGGFTLSFVKNSIESLYRLDVDTKGSQFRSRDIFPRAVAAVVDGNREEFLDAERNVSSIPDRPRNRVAHVDGFGNLKLSTRESELNLSTGEVRLEVNSSTINARRAEGIFAVEEGEFVFAPGSSGGEDPYMELALRGGSAEEFIGEVEPGDKVEWKPV